MDLGCYPAHWLRARSGGEHEVVSARFVPNPLGADLTIDAELAIEEGPLAGARALLHASVALGVPFAAPKWVVGERGAAVIDNLVLPQLGQSIVTTVDGVVEVRTVAGRETYEHELDGVVAALETGTQAATEGEDIIATMALLDVVYAAAVAERPLRADAAER